jgi:acyl carrier protein
MDRVTLEHVQAIASRVAGPTRCPEKPGPDTPLQDGGFWLDSASLLEVIMACEAEFDVAFDLLLARVRPASGRAAEAGAVTRP